MTRPTGVASLAASLLGGSGAAAQEGWAAPEALARRGGTYHGAEPEPWYGVWGTREFVFRDGKWSLTLVHALDRAMTMRTFRFRTGGAHAAGEASDAVEGADRTVFDEDWKHVTPLTAAPGDLERVARLSYGRPVAILAARGGPLQDAEDALGDALPSALRSRLRTGVPDGPEAWLLTAARRRWTDGERSQAVVRRHEAHLTLLEEERPLGDVRLGLMLACAHPAIAPEARAADAPGGAGPRRAAHRHGRPGGARHHGPAADAREAEDRAGAHPPRRAAARRAGGPAGRPARRDLCGLLGGLRRHPRGRRQGGWARAGGLVARRPRLPAPARRRRGAQARAA